MIIPVVVVILPIVLALSVLLLNVKFAHRLEPTDEPNQKPLVSVLVPARDEELNIARCLDSLSAQNYPDYEIIVLDDDSTDDTATIVEEYVRRDTRVRLLHGKRLPEGWTGKTWACKQLAAEASGDVLVFTDADNWHDPRAISSTVALMQRLRLDLLSAFPEQQTVTIAEKLAVPVIYLILHATLVLPLTLYAPFRSMSAANGQWLVFTRRAYKVSGGHDAVRNQSAEDIALARLAKRKRLRILAVDGTGMIYARMYSEWRAVADGFGKNLVAIAGGRSFNLALLSGWLLAIGLGPFVLLFRPATRIAGLLSVLLAAVLRGIHAYRFRFDVTNSVLLHPISVLTTIWIGIRSLWLRSHGGIIWKGRRVG